MLAPLALSLSASLLSAAPQDTDWPQWRGPRLDGSTTEKAWVAKGADTNLWEIDLGLGYSSVSVVDGKLYTMGHDAEGGLDVVWCLDAVTGEEQWTYAFPSKIWNQFHGGGTNTTPTVDGVVHVLNREGNYFALDRKTGEVLRERAFAKELEVEPPTWGFAGSPLVLDDELYLNLGKVVRLDKNTGKQTWLSSSSGHAYSTPAPFRWKDRELLAVFNGDGLAVLDRANGKDVARYPWETKYDVNAATPIAIDDALFISSGYNHGGALVAMSEDGLTPVWETREMKTQMSGAVLLGDHLYGFDDSVLKCFGLDGEERWEERGLGKGALTGAPGRLIVVSSRGELVIAEASPEGFRELSRRRVIEDGGEMWTKPVLVNGLIYARSSKGKLICSDHRAPSGGE